MRSLIFLPFLLLIGCATSQVEQPSASGVHESVGAARSHVAASRESAGRLGRSLTVARREADQTRNPNLTGALDAAMLERAVLDSHLASALDATDAVRGEFDDYKNLVAGVVEKANAAIARDKQKSAALVKLKLLVTAVVSLIAMAIAAYVFKLTFYGVPVLLAGAAASGGTWIILRMWLGT